MKKRDVLNSPRLLELKKARRRVVLNKIILSLIALALILGSLAYASRIPSLNISTIEIVGNKTIDTENIKKLVEEKMAGNYFWFFPKTNILFYPKNDIKNELQNKFKRLKDINLSIKNKVLQIYVTERTAAYLWCETPKEEKCFFLDNSGYIFDEAPYFSGEIYFKFYGPNFSKLNFEKLISFKETLEIMKLKPAGLFTEENGDVKIFLSNNNGGMEQPYIIFKFDSDWGAVTENLQVALANEPLKTNFKNKYSSLEYIDLRFGNKVYYKFK